MGDSERRRGRARRTVIVVAALGWAVLVFLWLVVWGARVPRFADAFLSHPWEIMGLVVAVTAVFWVRLWRIRARIRRLRGLVILKVCSDAFLIALFAGLLLLNWSSTVLTLVGLGVALSYVARFIRAGASLAAPGGTH